MRRRLPSPASARSTLPTLASLLAAGTLVEGCAHVECGEERIDEVRAHGPRGVSSLREGRVRDGLREIAVASGVLGHSATQVEPVHAAGAEAPVTVAPVTSTPEPVLAPGQMMVVTPQPEVNPPPPPPPPEVRRPPTVHRDPFVRPPDPRPLGGAPMPVTPPPRREALRGDMKSVGADPIGAPKR